MGRGNTGKRISRTARNSTPWRVRGRSEREGAGVGGWVVGSEARFIANTLQSCAGRRRMPETPPFGLNLCISILLRHSRVNPRIVRHSTRLTASLRVVFDFEIVSFIDPVRPCIFPPPGDYATPVYHAGQRNFFTRG